MTPHHGMQPDVALCGVCNVLSLNVQGRHLGPVIVPPVTPSTTTPEPGHARSAVHRGPHPDHAAVLTLGCVRRAVAARSQEPPVTSPHGPGLLPRRHPLNEEIRHGRAA